MTVVKWDITAQCNLSCRHCYNAHRQGSDELPLARITGLLDEMSATNVSLVQFLGGEPLLRPDFNDIIKHIALHSSALKWSISTNCQLLTAERALRLLECRPKLVTSSLDGPSPVTNDLIRGPGSYERVVAAIAALSHAKQRLGVPTRLAVNCVLCRPNAASIGDMVDLCSSMGIDLLIVDHLELYGRAAVTGYGLRLTPAEELSALETLAARTAKMKPTCTIEVRAPAKVLDWLEREYGVCLNSQSAAYCLAGSTVVHLAANGDVNPCNNPAIAQLIDQGRIEGVSRRELSVSQRTFEEVYNSRSLLLFFQAVYGRLLDSSRLSTCRNCRFFPQRCKAGCPLIGVPHEVCAYVPTNQHSPTIGGPSGEAAYYRSIS